VFSVLLIIALRSDLIVTPLKELDTACEVGWIKLEINKSKPLYIGSFYRTPSKDDPDVILSFLVGWSVN
jgi:hypothetical protein